MVTQSRSPGWQARSGGWVPWKTVVGRAFVYCCSGWHITSRRPQREICPVCTSGLSQMINEEGGEVNIKLASATLGSIWC